MHAPPTPCYPSSVHLASLRPSSPCNGSQLPILHAWLPEIVDNVILEVLLLNSLLGHGVSIWSAQSVPSCPIPSHVSVLVPFALHKFVLAILFPHERFPPSNAVITSRFFLKPAKALAYCRPLQKIGNIPNLSKTYVNSQSSQKYT